MSQENRVSVYRLNTKKPHILSLMLLSAFAVMGAIVMMPALPEISVFFQKSIGTTQLTATSFLLGYSIGQLIYGPLANRYGRKKALYTGIIIATLGSIFSILSAPIESFSVLILGRFLEAIGSSAGLAISFTIITDYYFENDTRKIMGLLMLAFAIVPGIAVAAGGILVQYMGWHACFYFLLAYGLLLIYPTYHLPETLSAVDLHATRFKKIVKNYKNKFLNKKLIGFAIITGFSSACVYVFGAEGPFIGIHLLQIPPALYGLLGLLPYIGTLIGSLIGVRLSLYNPMSVIKFAYTIECVATLCMLVLFLLKVVNLWTLLIPMGIFCVGHPIIAATCGSMSMQQDPDKSNTSAVLNFVAMGMPVLMTLLLSILHVSSAWVMPVIFMIGLFGMLFSYVSLIGCKTRFIVAQN
ncbi:MAG: MFS transporter [Coxiellaceae bacterium]|nr:MFS transporter [Coxiellaceae bacterium]